VWNPNDFSCTDTAWRSDPEIKDSLKCFDKYDLTPNLAFELNEIMEQLLDITSIMGVTDSIAVSELGALKFISMLDKNDEKEILSAITYKACMKIQKIHSLALRGLSIVAMEFSKSEMVAAAKEFVLSSATLAMNIIKLFPFGEQIAKIGEVIISAAETLNAAYKLGNSINEGLIKIKLFAKFNALLQAIDPSVETCYLPTIVKTFNVAPQIPLMALGSVDPMVLGSLTESLKANLPKLRSKFGIDNDDRKVVALGLIDPDATEGIYLDAANKIASAIKTVTKKIFNEEMTCESFKCLILLDTLAIAAKQAACTEIVKQKDTVKSIIADIKKNKYVDLILWRAEITGTEIACKRSMASK